MTHIYSGIENLAVNQFLDCLFLKIYSRPAIRVIFKIFFHSTALKEQQY